MSPTACSLRWARCCCTGTTGATTASASMWKPTTTRSAGISCICCTGAPPTPPWVRAMHTSLILYAEHEFNASTFAARVIAGTGSDLYSCDHRRHRRAARPQARRRQRGRVRDAEALRLRPTRPRRTCAAASRTKEVIIGFGHPVYTIADPRNKVIKEVARRLSQDAGRPEDVRHRRADRDGDVGREEDVPEPRLVLARSLSHDGRADGDVHAAVRHGAHHRLVGARHRAARATARSSARPPTTSGRMAQTFIADRSTRSRPPFATSSHACPPRSATSAPSPTGSWSTSPTMSPKLHDHERRGVRHRALLPDRHAGLRLRGARPTRPAPSCSGPIVPGTSCRTAPGCRARSFELDPVQAAFNIGA